MDVRYCTCCGSMLRPAAPCRKGCTAPIVSGDMGLAIALQGAYEKAQQSKVAQQVKPAAVAPAPTPAAKPHDMQCGAYCVEREVLAMRLALAVLRPYWRRACTCGHCMACIGE